MALKIMVLLLLFSCTKTTKREPLPDYPDLSPKDMKEISYHCSDSNLKEIQRIVTYCVNQEDVTLIKYCNHLTLQVMHITNVCSKVLRHQVR